MSAIETSNNPHEIKSARTSLVNATFDNWRAAKRHQGSISDSNRAISLITRLDPRYQSPVDDEPGLRKDLEVSVWEDITRENAAGMVGFTMEPVSEGSKECRLTVHVDGQAVRNFWDPDLRIQDSDNDATKKKKMEKAKKVDEQLMESIYQVLQTDCREDITGNTVAYGRPFPRVTGFTVYGNTYQTILDMAEKERKSEMEESQAAWSKEWAKLDTTEAMAKMYNARTELPHFVPNKKTQKPTKKTADTRITLDGLNALTANAYTKASGITKDRAEERKARYKGREYVLVGPNPDRTVEAYDAQKSKYGSDKTEPETIDRIVDLNTGVSDDEFRSEVDFAPVTYPKILDGKMTHSAPSETSEYMSINQPPDLNYWLPIDETAPSGSSRIFANKDDFRSRAEAAGVSLSSEQTA